MVALVNSSSEARPILVVEDNPTDVRLITALLRASSAPRFEVTHSRTLNDAIRHVETEAPTLVLLDLGLPDAFDLHALHRLRSKIPSIPIVVLTARDDDDLALRAIQEGAEDFLVKGTINGPLLLKSLRYALERHRSRVHLESMANALKEANARLARLIRIDPLTELLNRRGLQEAFGRLSEIRRRDQIDVMVLLVDLDDFKNVNDSLGHAVGDIALKETARKIRSTIRAVDYAGRLGGDEFLLLLPRARPEEAARIAERIRLAIGSVDLRSGEQALRITASIAGMMLSSEVTSIDEVLGRTHRLLLRSKSNGKNQISIQGRDGEGPGSATPQSVICGSLIRGEGLYAVRQPILDLDSGLIIGWEILSRYASDGTREMPTNFFRICAEENILNLVDHQCLRSCAAHAADLGDGVARHLNLFPSTLLQVPVEILIAELSRHAPLTDYCIELSEQQILGDPSHFSGPVAELAQAGVRIAIDDVGFGYSCLESLIELEPGVIKIDRRCVTDLSADPARWAPRLERLLSVATSLADQVIVEGIETPDQLAMLRRLGVRYGQGFLLGHPVAA